jgi:hypothetical protein
VLWVACRLVGERLLACPEAVLPGVRPEVPGWLAAVGCPEVPGCRLAPGCPELLGERGVEEVLGERVPEEGALPLPLLERPLEEEEERPLLDEEDDLRPPPRASATSGRRSGPLWSGSALAGVDPRVKRMR